MNKYDVERAIIANRPGEPFVLVERVDGDEITDLSALDWQAQTQCPTWDDVTAWMVAVNAANALAATEVTNGATLRQRANDALTNLAAADTNWATLTNVQKDAALHLAVRCLGALIRLELNELDQT